MIRSLFAPADVPPPRTQPRGTLPHEFLRESQSSQAEKKAAFFPFACCLLPVACCLANHAKDKI
jgi:hypothetical protein